MSKRSRRYLTVDEFKQKFKVGDVLYCYRHHTPIKITGLGISRFLYLHLESFGAYPNQEKTLAMDEAQGFSKIENENYKNPLKIIDPLLSIDTDKLISSKKRL